MLIDELKLIWSRAFTRIRKLFTLKSKQGRFGLSFDDGVKFSELPVRPEIGLGEFCEVDPQVGTFFEIIAEDKKNKTVTIREICTDNEHVIDIAFLNYLFVKSKIPKECEF